MQPSSQCNKKNDERMKIMIGHLFSITLPEAALSLICLHCHRRHCPCLCTDYRRRRRRRRPTSPSSSRKLTLQGPTANKNRRN